MITETIESESVKEPEWLILHYIKPNKAKGIAKEIDDSLQKLAKALRTVCPDPDVPVLIDYVINGKKIMKVVVKVTSEAGVVISSTKDFLKHQDVHLKVHNEKVRKNVKLKKKASCSNCIRDIDIRKFKHHKEFKFSDFSLSEWDELDAILNKCVPDLIKSLCIRRKLLAFVLLPPLVDGIKLNKIESLLASGGLSKNSLFIQEHADITSCSIIQPWESESVLLDAAILGVVATKKYPGLREAMKALNVTSLVFRTTKDMCGDKEFPEFKIRLYNNGNRMRYNASVSGSLGAIHGWSPELKLMNNGSGGDKHLTMNILDYIQSKQDMFRSGYLQGVHDVLLKGDSDGHDSAWKSSILYDISKNYPDMKSEDRPDIISRVFEMKL
ncbi:FGGY family of carbohydrate kinase [Tanacetum coccineum]